MRSLARDDGMRGGVHPIVGDCRLDRDAGSDRTDSSVASTASGSSAGMTELYATGQPHGAGAPGMALPTTWRSTIEQAFRHHEPTPSCRACEASPDEVLGGTAASRDKRCHPMAVG